MSKSNFFSKKSEINVFFIDSYNSSNSFVAFKAIVPISPLRVNIEKSKGINGLTNFFSR